MAQKDIDLSKLTAEQDAYKQTAGKYQQARPQDVKQQADGSLVYIDELVGPLGAGYVVCEQKVVATKTLIKATGYGAEAAYRTFGWTELVEKEV